MTRKRLHFWVSVTVAVFAAAIAAGIAIKIAYPDKNSLVYSTYKDLIPLGIAIPAAWLSYCFQRRSSYLRALRALWSDLIHAGNQAVDYTRWDSPRSEEHFRRTIEDLSEVIDAVRGVFKNVPKKETPQGLFPYENIKEIRVIIGWLGYGDQYTKERCEKAHQCIVRLWGVMHYALLQEFDTEVPTFPVSKFLLDEGERGPDLKDALLKDNLSAELLNEFDEKHSLPRV